MAMSLLLASRALLASVLGVSLPLSSVRAAPNATASERDQVDAYVDAGTAKYEQGDYLGAVTEFKAAYALDPDPNFLYNIGRTYEEAGQLEMAVDYYRRFAKQPGISLELRKQAADRIKVLDEILAETTPEAAEPPAEPGAPETSSAPTQPVIMLGPADQPADQPAARPGRSLRISGYVLLGLGLSAVGTGAILGGLAREDSSDLLTTDEPQARTTLIDRGTRKAVAADAALITGGVVAVTGVVLVLVGVTQGRRATQRTALAPSVGRRHAGATLRVRF